MRRSLPLRRLAAAIVLGACLLAPGTGRAADDRPPLRVCADPDDLPFSSAKADAPGIYVELGQTIARSLGRPFEPVWALSYFGKRMVRATLLSKQCDAFVGLPGIKGFMGPQLVYSKPFLHIGYAVMAPAGTRITRLDDLVRRRVGVQFATPPQILLASRDDIWAMTFMNPEDAVRALGRHELDAAFVWGPVAGYLNKTEFNGAYQVTPVSGDGMQYPVKVGFTRADEDLRDRVDAALDGSRPVVAALVAKYGLPTASPIALADTSPRVILAAATETETVPTTGPAPEQSASQPYEGDTVEAGHKIFNGTCSHCHGPDAVQSVKKIDLRLLHHRYGEATESVFHETVTHGRPAKGMPNWSKVFSEEDFKKIYAYLSTIQTD